MTARPQRIVPIEGLSLSLHFEGLSGPVVVQDAPEVIEGLRQVLRGWPVVLAPLGRHDSQRAVSRVLRQGKTFKISSAWLDEPLTDLPAASAVCGVVADLAQTFYHGQPEALALHCGAFLINGRLVAMTGHARAGKSTFMARLTAEPDLSILCDDVLPLLADNQAMGLGIAPRLRFPLPANASEAFHAHVARHCMVRDDRYGYVSAPNVAPFGTRAPLSVLVVLERAAGAKAKLHHLPPAEAVHHLLAQNMAPIAPDALDATMERLLRLAEGLFCVKLVYSDLEPAVSLVRAAFGADMLPDPSVEISPPRAGPPAEADANVVRIEANVVVRRTNGIGMRRVRDEVFLWHATSGAVCHLNPVAGAIWRILEEPATANEIASLLAEGFDLPDSDGVTADVCQFLSELAASDMVTPASS